MRTALPWAPGGGIRWQKNELIPKPPRIWQIISSHWKKTEIPILGGYSFARGALLQHQLRAAGRPQVGNRKIAWSLRWMMGFWGAVWVVGRGPAISPETRHTPFAADRAGARLLQRLQSAGCAGAEGKPIAAGATELQNKPNYISLAFHNKLHFTKTPALVAFPVCFVERRAFTPTPGKRAGRRAGVSPCLLCPQGLTFCLDGLMVWQNKEINW